MQRFERIAKACGSSPYRVRGEQVVVSRPESAGAFAAVHILDALQGKSKQGHPLESFVHTSASVSHEKHPSHITLNPAPSMHEVLRRDS